MKSYLDILMEAITGYDYSKMRKLTDKPEPIGSDDIASVDDQKKAADDAKARVAAKRAGRAKK